MVRVPLLAMPVATGVPSYTKVETATFWVGREMKALSTFSRKGSEKLDLWNTDGNVTFTAILAKGDIVAIPKV